MAIATSPAAMTSTLLPAAATVYTHNQQLSILNARSRSPITVWKPPKRLALKFQAAKLPAGVELPKEVPKYQPPFLGFTRTAETWNARACMIGLVGIFIVELIMNKGILQIIGVEVGKGLDLPL